MHARLICTLLFLGTAALSGCGGGGGADLPTSVTPPTPAIKTVSVTTSVGEGGSASPASSSVNSGTAAVVNISPKTGFDVASVTGCNGKLAGLTYTTEPLTADCTVTVTFKDIRLTLAGSVYERLDTVAYAPDTVPSQGIAGAAVALRTGTASSDSMGRFSIRFEPAAKRDMDDLGASAGGFMAGSWPWNDKNLNHPLALGLYKAPSPVARPGFVGGVIPHDVGGLYLDVYDAGLFLPTLQRARQKASANLVTLVDTIEVTQFDVTGTKVSMEGSPPWPNKTWPQISARNIYTQLVAHARSTQQSVMMMLQIYPGYPIIGPYFKELHRIDPQDRAFWKAWFDAFKPRALERAALVRDLNMEYLALGLNQVSSVAPVSFWKDLVEAIRNIGYRGKLGMFGGGYDQREFTHGRSDMLEFAGLFDYLGVSFYAVVRARDAQEVLSRQQTRARMRADIASELDRYRNFGVPIIALLGTPSVFGGATSGEYIEPCLPCNSVAPDRTQDLMQQADVYQAMFEVINARPTGAGQVMGLISWGYHYRDDPSMINSPNDSSYDKSASIRGKPAEAVMKFWMDAWGKP